MTDKIMTCTAMMEATRAHLQAAMARNTKTGNTAGRQAWPDKLTVTMIGQTDLPLLARLHRDGQQDLPLLARLLSIRLTPQMLVTNETTRGPRTRGTVTGHLGLPLLARLLTTVGATHQQERTMRTDGRPTLGGVVAQAAIGMTIEMESQREKANKPGFTMQNGA